MAVIISNNPIKSGWVEKELNVGLTEELEKQQVFVLPILIEDCDMPLFLKDKLFADFRTNYEAGITALLKRLIPEKTVESPKAVKTQSQQIQRQPIQPRPEELLIKIIDVKINGRHPQASALYEVSFELDKVPDEDWCSLFESPTAYSFSIHKAHVHGNEIQWMASEDDMKNKKHWIYDWVDDANKRYLPVIQTRIAKKEQKFIDTQLESAKLAELESLLKEGREGTLVFPTDEVMVGKCSLHLDECAAPNTPGPITQVNFENKGFIHVCFTCLQKQLDEGHWKEN